MYYILLQYHIVGYFCYIDDILIIYNNKATNVHEVFTVFNNITPTVKLTMEEEIENKINFLDITISKAEKTYHSIYIENQLQQTPLFQTIRATLQNTSLQYLTNRLSTYTVNNTEKEKTR